ncbi:MAG: LPS assembly lipoprotein LptE [Phycisphaerales bacterium]
MSTLHAFRPRAWARVAVAFALLVGVGLLLPACASDPAKGYAFSSSYDAGIASINVPIFDNTTFSRGIETELAAALVAEVRKSTPWRVDQSDAAQTTLRGSITSSELRKISTARDSGFVEQLAVEITVDFEWKDNRTGKVLVGRRAFSAAEAFVPARGTSGPVNERLELGQHATVAELARAIVGELRSGW